MIEVHRHSYCILPLHDDSTDLTEGVAAGHTGFAADPDEPLRPWQEAARCGVEAFG